MSVTNSTSVKEIPVSETINIMEQMVERENMTTAYKKVVGNK